LSSRDFFVNLFVLYAKNCRQILSENFIDLHELLFPRNTLRISNIMNRNKDLSQPSTSQSKSEGSVLARSTEVVTKDYFGTDPYFAEDIFFKDYIVGGDSSSSAVVHMNRCALKHRDPVKETLDRIFKDNSNARVVISLIKRRPSNELCYCQEWKYDISLKTKHPCHGCGRLIRSSRHVCKTYDLFKPDEWLSKEKCKIHTTIRYRNFVSLAQRLPYVLPNSILGAATDLTSSCQNVIFFDRIM